MKRFKRVTAMVLAVVTTLAMTLSVSASAPNVYARETIAINPETGHYLGCSCTDCCAKNYQVYGYITNGTTGAKISGATITFRSGYNKKSGTAYKKVTSKSTGYYSATLKKGKYTIAVSKSGYITTYVNYNCTAKKRVDISISPTMKSTTYRAVLTWGLTPYDLDAHLTGPTSGTSRFHVAYYNKYAYNGGKQVANLDVDDRVSYGPETITINFANGVNGTYRYYIHDYSDRTYTSSNKLAKSGARVVLYNGSKQVAVYTVPNKYGTLWHVFDLVKSGSKITVKKYNTMSYQSTPSYISSSLRTSAAKIKK